ncbi:DUF485 domain-containing protein [Saccharopolyspora taberi]|uniref:DUF485 domain-containing protein n=1 Tax=Saccharopolyspora taberi TaxID=60895 RepID=A0ABN3VBW1_9PSEU
MPHATQSQSRRAGDARRPAAFGAIDRSAARREIPEPDFPAIARSRDFLVLRRRLRAFVFPMSALFFVWYLGYVVLAAYFHDFMSTRLFGVVNVGLVMGVGQFASTILITALYLQYAARRIDPRVAALHREVTGGEPS